MFVTEKYSSKFTIISFWVPALKSPAENGIPRKSLETSLVALKKLLILTVTMKIFYLQEVLMQKKMSLV